MVPRLLGVAQEHSYWKVDGTDQRSVVRGERFQEPPKLRKDIANLIVFVADMIMIVSEEIKIYEKSKINRYFGNEPNKILCKLEPTKNMLKSNLRIN